MHAAEPGASSGAGPLIRSVRRRAQVELMEGFFHRRCTQIDADSFRVFRVIRGYIVAVASPAVADSSEIFGRRFLSDELWDAEPDRCTEPPFALGTGALEFWTFDKSGFGGR